LSSILVSAGEGFLTSGASAGKTLLVKVSATVIKNTVQVKTTEDGISTNIDTEPINVVKNTAIDLSVGAIIKGVSKLPTSSVNKGEVVKGVKKVYKKADIDITRKLNEKTKEVVETVVDKTVPKVIEKTTKVLTNEKKKEVKKKTFIYYKPAYD